MTVSRLLTLAVIAFMYVSGCASINDQHEQKRVERDAEIASEQISAGPQNTVIMIGLDGLRWDAVDRADTPALDSLIKSGVRADKGMQASFPSKTFPNFYALATGRYPENHGFLVNRPYDPEFDETYTNAQVMQERWWVDGEPIWTVLEKADIRTATTGWVGSEASLGGVAPTYSLPYAELRNMMPHERVNNVLALLDKPEGERPHFLTLYHDDVDVNAHKFGVGSPEEKAAIERMDGMVGMLLEGLKARNLMDKVDLIVVSDHGMVNVDLKKKIYLDDIIDISKVRQSNLDLGPFAAIWPLDKADTEDLFATLKAANNPHLTVMRGKDAYPHAWNGEHKRTPPIMVVVEPDWFITTRAAEQRASESGWAVSPKGNHGYLNTLQVMRATFIASGPHFADSTTVDVFENVNIHGMIAEILGVQPARNDGSPEVWRKPFDPAFKAKLEATN